jgi:hypothetical protein
MDDVEELDLYAWNTGELYPKRKAIIAEMKDDISTGVYASTLAWKRWVPWYTEAARRYRKEIDSSTHFSRATIVKAAKERVKEEHDKIKRGEYD